MSVRSSRNNGTGQNQELEIPDDAVDGLNQSTARASHRGLIPRARVKVILQYNNEGLYREVFILISSNIN